MVQTMVNIQYDSVNEDFKTDLTTNDSNNYTQKKGLNETQRELKSN